MTRFAKSIRCKKNPPAWHAGFETMLPTIEAHAQYTFRRLDAEAREEAVQQAVCLACQAYRRLVELGRTDVAYASALATFAVRQTKVGRKVGGSLNCRDILDQYCQHQKNITVERLDRHDNEDDCWAEAVVEDRTAGPADIAATRIDFAAWLQLLPRRLKKIATFLAQGETTLAASKRFRLSPGRISQIRRQLFEAWHKFQGDLPVLAAA